MVSVNTNIGSLNARVAQLRTQNSEKTAIARLSSGLRINSAGDDAAGLSVATKMNAQIASMNMAVRNSMDGISLIDTATSAISTNLNALQRIRELSIQASNGIYEDQDRENLQLEVTKNLEEIRKTANFTEFNGVKLLDGSLDTVLRVGNNNNELINVKIEGVGIDQSVPYKKSAIATSNQLATPSIEPNSTDDFTLLESIGREASYNLPNTSLAFGGSEPDVDVPSYASVVAGSAFSSQSAFTSKTGAFENNDFSDATVENTTVTPYGTKVEIPGWDVYLERVDLGPVKAGLYQETIGGHPTPNDPTPNPVNNTSGDEYPTDSPGTLSYSASAANGLMLKSNSIRFTDPRVNPGDPLNYSVAHGPYVISDNAVTLAAGDSVSFDWQANYVDDDYDVYGYLLDKNTGQVVELLDSNGRSGTGTVNKSIGVGQDGDYNFVFISGTYDESGFFVAGAEFFIDNITVNQANPPPIVATATVGVEAVESYIVAIKTKEFGSMREMYEGDPNGTFSISGGADANKFEIDSTTGVVSSRHALWRRNQSTYTIDVSYLGLGGDNHTETVTLTVTPNERAIAEYHSEEATQITINTINDSASGLQQFINVYGAGNYSLADDASASGDYQKFSIDNSGTIITNEHLKFIEKNEFNFNKIYTLASGKTFIEKIKLTLIDPIKFSRTEAISEEGKKVKIAEALSEHLYAFASLDAFEGQFYLADSDLANSNQSEHFRINQRGEIESKGELDFDNGTREFEFKVIYLHSTGRAQFTDFVKLSLTNDIRDENNLAIDDIDISYIGGATEASSRLNDTINKVSSILSELGALKNRLIHGIDFNLGAILTLQFSKGRISDADYAVEASKLAKNQILSQASLAMLAQANKVQNNILELIR